MSNPGIKALRKIVLAKEVTAGTEVRPGTALWRGTGVFEDKRETTFPAEDIGVISGLDRSYVAKLLGGLSFDSTPATYEQLPYILAAGVKALTTGVADGGGSGKIYAYPFSTTTKNAIQTYSLQGGDDNEVEFGAYGVVEKFTLDGKAGESWMLSADWFTQSVTPGASVSAMTISFDDTAGYHINDSGNGLGAFAVGDRITVSGSTSNDGTYTVTNATAGILTVTEAIADESAGDTVTVRASYSAPAVAAVEEILFGGSKLYIDSTTIGTTLKSATLLAAKADFKTGLIPVWTGDQVYFTFAKLTPPEISLQITFEHDGTSSAEKAAWRAQTHRFIRIVSEGSALTAGTTYSKKSMVLDFGGKWEKFDKLGEQNGNDIVTGTLKVKPSTTSNTFCALTVVNTLASLT